MLAMRRDGSVLSWGYGAQGQLGRLGSRMRNPEETMLLPGLVPLHNIQGLLLAPFPLSQHPHCTDPPALPVQLFMRVLPAFAFAGLIALMSRVQRQ